MNDAEELRDVNVYAAGMVVHASGQRTRVIIMLYIAIGIIFPFRNAGTWLDYARKQHDVLVPIANDTVPA